MAKITIGADTETYDPLLKKQGYSWKYGQGYILCTALYYEAEDRIEVLAGLHNENCPYSRAQRLEQNQKIRALLTNPDVRLVGANITYDIAWWLYELGMSTYEVKCSFIDVLIAERFLNEFDTPDLEKLSWAYLRYGKTKQRVEAWVRDNVSKKGDFRQHLKDAPWELTDEYVRGDAKNPVKIWRKQLTLLKEQDLCKRVKLEFDILLPALQMTMNGLPIDEQKKKENYEYLSGVVKKFRAEFIAKYNLPNFRVTATRDVASFLDSHNIPYNYMITLTGKNGVRFRNGEETDNAYRKAKQIVSQFRLKKGKPVAYVPKEMAERTVALLNDEGFMCNSSPNLDKKYREAKREGYPEVALIDDWKKANDICSKILGDAYNRFYTKNFKGETCVKPQVKTADTKTHRMSENMPNCLAKGTQVLTIDGYKNIEDLTHTDYVFTHNGEVARVKNVWNKGKQIPICLTTDTNKSIICTSEHKFFTPKGWVKAEDLEEVYECKQITVKQSGSVQERFDLYQEESFPYSVSRCRRVWSNLSHSFSYLDEIRKQRGGRETSQLSCFRGKEEDKRNEREETKELQGSLLRLQETSDCSCNRERQDKESVRAQSNNGRTDRNTCRKFTCTPARTSYKWEWRGQQERKSVSVYSKSTFEITQNIARIRRVEEGKSEIEVYDIEVDSEDHSFIADGFVTHNCQQIPSKGGLIVGGKEISFPKITRALFRASKGCVFGKIDYGQIEYRLICNIACGESGKEVRRQYAENPHLDFHQYVVDLTGLSRKYAKNMSFGVSFGMGLPSMAENFGWTIEHAEEIAEAYHSKMPFVAPTLALVGDTAKERGYIRTAYGARARLKNKKKAYSMLNRYTQESGAEAMKCAIRQSYEEGVFERLKTSNVVHDELNFPYLEPTEEQMIDLYRMAQIMREAMPDLRVPLEASPELGDNWASTKEVTEWIELRDKNDEAWTKASDNLKKAVNICDRLLKEGRVAV